MTLSSYQQLETIFTTRSHIDNAMAILHWDAATYMPEGGSEARGEQLATLTAMSYDLLADPKVSELLENAKAQKHALSDWQNANLREMERIYLHQNAVEKSLKTALVKAGNECEMIWRTARSKNDFATYAASQANVLELTKQVAQAKADALHVDPYDALIDQFTPGLTQRIVDPIFAKLTTFLPDFIEQVIEKQAADADLAHSVENHLPKALQQSLMQASLHAIGFDFSKGRLDESVHPFCGGFPSDIRITTRYDENHFAQGLMGVNHEAGHAMYEQQLPKEWRSQPVGHALGMAMHESQSLLIEMQACRSKSYLRFLSQELNHPHYGFKHPTNPDALFALYTKVEKSFIRVDADEVTYPLHVILRYECEKELIAGRLVFTDLPDFWNEKMRHYLGITPPNVSQGCMQDIHWTDGSFGYFPAYTLGAIIAAQLFDTAITQHADIPAQIQKGQFAPLTKWLGTHIHAFGSKLSMSELLIQATGRDIDVDHYIAYLSKRYLRGETI